MCAGSYRLRLLVGGCGELRCAHAQIQGMQLTRDALLMKLGSAQSKAPAAWRVVDVCVEAQNSRFTYRLSREKLKQVRHREGRYLLNVRT